MRSSESVPARPRTVAIVQARMTSTRLPGKVMLPLAGAAMLARVVERAARIPGVDQVCVAMPEGEMHRPIADLVGRLDGVALVRGPEDDVLRRYVMAAEACGAEVVVRVTSDCPFIDPDLSGALLAALRAARAAAATLAYGRGFPHGLHINIASAEALRAADRESRDSFEREHVMPFIFARPERFPTVTLGYAPDRSHWRLTVDDRADYERASRVYDRLHPRNPVFGLAEIEALFAAEPALIRTGGA